ncbi:hypothetical protein HX776_19520 [Pseudomonas agarici]|uniref:hypothetical protein n=1 Tax=Pseudomonas agarici TaxID=46677 RepID=UPI0002DE6A87|nr:hypothetical protein [Pseudomonas agarici]NWC10994.1 hypothetical protein [Pseudomonas agarici]SEL35480.1 hypothetical protein SAMN05216604_11636 [Pseudomonas agarici]
MTKKPPSEDERFFLPFHLLLKCVKAVGDETINAGIEGEPAAAAQPMTLEDGESEVL